MSRTGTLRSWVFIVTILYDIIFLRSEVIPMLTVSEIKSKISPICKKYGVNKAYLFGSYARGEANENSDIDLHIEKGAIKNLFQMCGFREDIISALGKNVDIVSIMPKNLEFRKNLLKEEILLYEI